MNNKEIVNHGLLHDYVNMDALIKAKANNIAFKCQPKRYKVIKSIKIGGLRKGSPRILKLTNKSCNYNYDSTK